MVEGAPDPAVADPPRGRPRVLYVMGAGRSGSTILGVTLGNCPGVFYAGELDSWLGGRGLPALRDEARLRFWEQVAARVEGAEEIFGHEATRALDRSIAAVRVDRWPARRRLRARYLAVAERLYRAIATASGTEVVVDSSHYPLRARELQRLEGIELHILYLVRDPQEVVASFNNREVAQYTKSTLTTNVYLWLTNLLAILVFLRQPPERRLLVRYERFTEDPESVLADILRLVGSQDLPGDFSALRTGVAFQGNRLLGAPTLALRRGTSPARRRSPLTTLMQLPFEIILERLRPVAGAAPDGSPARAGSAGSPRPGGAPAGSE